MLTNRRILELVAKTPATGIIDVQKAGPSRLAKSMMLKKTAPKPS